MSDIPPSDDELLSAIRAGNDGALRVFMGRYDRLIRFAIYRIGRMQCVRDPQWLDSIASEVWSGFIKGLHRGGSYQKDLRTYLLQIARNKCVDAIRRDRREQAVHSRMEPGFGELLDEEPGPLDLLETLEDVERLRDCVSRLNPGDQVICRQIPLIVERKWQEAGRVLGMPESTLRSRWSQILDNLSRCMKGTAP